MRSIKLFVFILLFLSSTYCFADDNVEEFPYDLDQYEIINDKIYIQPDQIFMTNEGIFLFIQGVQVVVTQLN